MNVTKRARIHEPQLLLNERPGKRHSWRELGNRPLTEVPAGNEIRNVEAVLIPDELAVDVDDTAGRFSEFGGIIGKIHIHALDRIDRNIGAQASRGCVRHIKAIQLIADLIRTRAVNVKLASV